MKYCRAIYRLRCVVFASNSTSVALNIKVVDRFIAEIVITRVAEVIVVDVFVMVGGSN